MPPASMAGMTCKTRMGGISVQPPMRSSFAASAVLAGISSLSVASSLPSQESPQVFEAVFISFHGQCLPEIILIYKAYLLFVHLCNSRQGPLQKGSPPLRKGGRELWSPEIFLATSPSQREAGVISSAFFRFGAFVVAAGAVAAAAALPAAVLADKQDRQRQQNKNNYNNDNTCIRILPYVSVTGAFRRGSHQAEHRSYTVYHKCHDPCNALHQNDACCGAGNRPAHA